MFDDCSFSVALWLAQKHTSFSRVQNTNKCDGLHIILRCSITIWRCLHGQDASLCRRAGQGFGQLEWRRSVKGGRDRCRSDLWIEAFQYLQATWAALGQPVDWALALLISIERLTLIDSYIPSEKSTFMCACFEILSKRHSQSIRNVC